jgi:nicotinamidase-related amidase
MMGNQLMYLWFLVSLSVTLAANHYCGSTNGKFPPSTAFLFLDYEVGILATLPNSTAKTSFLSQSSSWLGYVRASKYSSSRIMFSTVQFRPGYPDVSCRNILFSYVASIGTLIEGSASTQFYTGFQPNSNEIQFVKQRYSAAYNSQLLTLLDSQCIDTVVLAGQYTSGVILSTTRQLADMDYNIYVIQDAVIDPNSTVNQVLLNSVLPTQATVLTVNAAKNML